jgi:hypothetical protein
MEKEVDQAKKVFKEAFDVLNDFFEEKRSDTVYEKIKKAKTDQVALAKFDKSFFGTTNEIRVRILIGQREEVGDYIYEVRYDEDERKPRLYKFKIKWGRPVKKILKDFEDPDWKHYIKVKEYKSVTEYLEYVYDKGIMYKKEKHKKEDALNVLMKGLKRALKALGEDVKEKKGINDETAKKIAKVVAITAATTIVSAVLTPAAGIVIQEIASGGTISGNVMGEAAQAAGQGLKDLVDPTNMARKAVKKVLTKGRSVRD